jgi:NAD(P)-dependent dehydrogenase (short-subunit alcohol dehydrogenase family)
MADADGTQVVLTTGANSGIGLATAIEAARRGMTSVGSVRSSAKAKVLREAADAAGVEVDTVLLDVTDADQCRSAVQRVIDRHGGVDALVNNAGYALTGAVEEVDDAAARHLLETMVVAPARLARLVLPGMRAAGAGTIVNVSSIYGRTTTPLSGWYQGAKHALEGLSDALRMEVASDGIRVVLVEPGGFRTGIWDEFDDESAGEGTKYELAHRRTKQAVRLSSPIMGEPASCARVILRAIESRSPRARYLVGVDAKVLAAASQLTPTPIKDRVTRFVLGL